MIARSGGVATRSSVRILAAAVLLGSLLSGLAPAAGTEQRLVLDDAAGSEFHGRSVAMDGETVVVGAPGDASGAGSVTVYVRCGGLLVEQGRVTASDAAADDAFGAAVAVSGHTLVVGAPANDDDGTSSGAAYVFTRTGGAWSQQQKITASNGAANDAFGTAVGASGDTVVVGAPGDAGVNGAAYVFARSGGSWSQQQILAASDAAAADAFGVAVAVDGDTLLVGADGNDDAGGESGAAYVFTRLAGTWSEETILTAGNAAAGDHFGIAVSLSGETLAVGGDRRDGAGADSGAVWLFTVQGGAWAQDAYLTPSDAVAGDEFGRSVSLVGDALVVGAPGDDDDGSASGAAWLFTRTGPIWSEHTKFTASDGAAGDELGTAVATNGESVVAGAPGDVVGGVDGGSVHVFRGGLKVVADDAAAGDEFGDRVAVSGNTMIVGARHEADGGSQSGAAYVFVRAGGLWTQQQKLTAPGAEASDLFGCAVAIDGDTALVGASGDNDRAANAGAAYVFTRSAGVWSLQATLTASDGAAADHFGGSVALRGTTAAIGAAGVDGAGSNRGAVYIFTESAGAWTEQQVVTASDPDDSHEFGGAVSVDGDTLLVGALGDDAGGDASGAAYLYTRSGSTWTQQVKLQATTPAATQHFGASVAVREDTAVVGAMLENGAGAAYVFARGTTGTWTVQQRLTGSDSISGDQFGVAVSVYGNTLVVGAWRDAEAAGAVGAAYVFTRAGTTWTEQSKVAPPDGAAADAIGVSVCVDGDTVAVGASGDDDAGSSSGSVHVFQGWFPGASPLFAHVAKLKVVASPTAVNFGRALAVDGGFLFVDSPQGGGDNAGSVFVYELMDGAWVEGQRLAAANGDSQDRFGEALAVDGDTLLVGVFADDDGAKAAGAAYVYVLVDGTWVLQQKLTGSPAAAEDRFGWSVAVDGDTAVIGAPGTYGGGPGAAFVFTRSGGMWTQQVRLSPAALANGDDFGWAVGVSGDTVAVGSPDYSTGGSVWVYEHDEGTWPEQQVLVGSDTGGGDGFGAAVSVDGETVAVGAPYDYVLTAPDGGSTYLFTRSENTWSQEQKLTAVDYVSGRYFGISVALVGDRVLVGKSSVLAGPGTAFLFERTDDSWALQQSFTAPAPVDNDQFATAVAFDGETLLMGTHRETGESGNSGAAHVFAQALPVLRAMPVTFPDEVTTTVDIQRMFSAVDGTGPFAWSIDGDAGLAAGLDPVTGVLDTMWGDPGTHAFTVRVTDACGTSREASYSVLVNPLPVIDAFDPAEGFFGRSLAIPFAASGGTPPLTWSPVDGALPGGLSFDTGTATISGTPGEVGSFSVDLLVTDGSGVEATATFDIEVTKLADLDSKDKVTDTLPIVRSLECIGGTTLDVAVVASASGVDGSTLEILDPEGSVVDLGTTLKSSRKGFKVRRLLLPVTGRYRLTLGQPEGFQGTATLGLKVKAPKKGAGTDGVTGGTPLVVTVSTLPGATLKLSVKAAKGSPAIPTILSVRDEGGNELIGTDAVKDSKKGAGLTLTDPLSGGDLTVTFGLRDGTAGDISWKAKVKQPKGYGFQLDD